MKYLLHEADRIDAGKLEQEDVLDPQGYVLISMTTDGRNAGDEPYWLKVINLLRDKTLEETLERRRGEKALPADPRRAGKAAQAAARTSRTAKATSSTATCAESKKFPTATAS